MRGFLLLGTPCKPPAWAQGPQKKEGVGILTKRVVDKMNQPLPETTLILKGTSRGDAAGPDSP